MRHIVEKKRKEFLRKKSQEDSKLAQEKELQSYHELVDSYQAAALEKAGEKKDAQIRDRALVSGFERRCYGKQVVAMVTAKCIAMVTG